MKTIIIYVFAFFIFSIATAQNTKSYLGFGNFKSNISLTKSHFNLSTIKIPNNTKYIFGNNAVNIYGYQRSYFPSILQQQITSNVSIGFNIDPFCLYPTNSILLGSNLSNNGYQFSTTEIIIGNTIQAIQILDILSNF
ncbi:hypothetical protein [Aquimarina algicola]|uniref:Uncharacterized protein n=1 Tax=Aquimarina algicola TaxID=2589995 RepID=A0A504J9P1_9FLAO|nr:hypothetical protein [Aquimarina algicola]TPN85315.1 hypothetical protein FHK87_14945 [Aquimarina algicola]